MPTNTITTAIINAAILGFEQQKRGIDLRIAELWAMLPRGSANGTTIRPNEDEEEVQCRCKAKDGPGTKGTMGQDQGRIRSRCSIEIGEAEATEDECRRPQGDW